MKKYIFINAGMLSGLAGTYFAFCMECGYLPYILGLCSVISGIVASVTKSSYTRALISVVLGVYAIAISFMLRKLQ